MNYIKKMIFDLTGEQIRKDILFEDDLKEINLKYFCDIDITEYNDIFELFIGDKEIYTQEDYFKLNFIIIMSKKYLRKENFRDERFLFSSDMDFFCYHYIKDKYLYKKTYSEIKEKMIDVKNFLNLNEATLGIFPNKQNFYKEVLDYIEIKENEIILTRAPYDIDKYFIKEEPKIIKEENLKIQNKYVLFFEMIQDLNFIKIIKKIFLLLFIIFFLIFLILYFKRKIQED